MDMIEVDVTIEETVSETFKIKVPANCEDPIEKAMNIARKKYWNSDLVLEPGNLTASQMCATLGDEATEWVDL